MSATNATITPPNIILSPMQVTFNSVDLGGTEGGVQINPKYDQANIMVDQYGKTVVDAAVSGQHYEVKLTLAEVKYKPNWKVAFPSAAIVGTNQAMYFSMNIGDRMSSHQAKLVLHPLANSPSDLSGDYTFWTAVATSVADLKYGPDKQVGLACTFMVLPDSGVIPPRFMFFGDTSVALVAASASAVVVGSNTGNGTITAIAVSNAYTKTETITITVLGQTGGNNIGVSGSVSGPLGTVHVGATSTNTANFTSNPINFTVTQGTVEFAVNDSWTISTTGSNYV